MLVLSSEGEREKESSRIWTPRNSNNKDNKDHRLVDDTTDAYPLLYDYFLINRKVFERKNHSPVETSVTV